MKQRNKISSKEKLDVGEKAKSKTTIATSFASPDGNRGSTYTCSSRVTCLIYECLLRRLEVA